MKFEPHELQVVETDRQICIARFSPCGQYLVTGGYDAVLRRWDFSPPPEQAEEVGEEASAQAQAKEESKKPAKKKGEKQDQPAPRELAPVTGHHGWLQTLAFAPPSDSQARLLYAADSWGQLCAWPYADEKPQPVWRHEQAHDGWIRALSVSADGKLLATAGRDQMVRVWNAADGKLLHEFAGHEHDIYSVAVHPNSEAVVSGDLMGNLFHWDLATGKQARRLQIDEMHFYDRIQDVAGMRILAFHDGGKTLICAGSDPTKAGRAFGVPTIRLVDWDTLKTRETWSLGVDKDGYVFDLHPHPQGFFMMVTSGPPGAGRFLLHRPGEEKPFFEYTKMYNTHSLAPHPDGRRAVVVATNRQSQGNGAVLDKEGNYLGNSSPLHVFDLVAAEA